MQLVDVVARAGLALGLVVEPAPSGVLARSH
jgi:hypothetical protein